MNRSTGCCSLQRVLGKILIALLLAALGASSYIAVTATQELKKAREREERAVREVEAERRRAEQEARRAREAATRAEREAEQARKAEAKAREAARREEQQLERAQRLVYASQLSLAQSAFKDGNGALALQYLKKCAEGQFSGWGRMWQRFATGR